MSSEKTEIIYKEISKLAPDEILSLLSRLVSELSVSLNRKTNLSISNIKGIGKEIWEDIDVQDYVCRERASWQ